MRRRALVSVVIPCYNPKHFLRETLATVQAQSYRPIETIVVNDGTDNAESLALLESLAGSVTCYIEQPNRGLGAARNAGFRAATGACVLPLDADDRIAPSFVAQCMAALEAHPQAAFVYTDYCIFGDEERICASGEYNLFDLLDQNIICYASLVRRADWELAGGYDESMRMGYEDWDFWLRLGERGRFGRRLPRVLFEYRKHGPSLYTVALQHHQELVEKIHAQHPRLYSHDGRVRVKTEWKPSVCVLRASAGQFAMEEQTIEDVEIPDAQDPRRAAARSRAPAFLMPEPGKILQRQSAEMCALAVWSGKTRLRLPDGSLCLSRGALAGETAPRRHGWLGYVAQMFRSRPSGVAEAPSQTAPDYFIRPDGIPERHRIALATSHLGLGAANSVLLETAQRIDRSRWEVLVIATQPAKPSDDAERRQQWRQAADHVYELAAAIEPERMMDAVYFLVRNWKIDLLVIQNSLAGYGAVADLRQALPGIRVVELMHSVEEEWSADAARASTECRPDLRVVVTEEGRQRWRGIDLERLDSIAGAMRTVLFAEQGCEDRSVRADAFFPAGQPGAAPELPAVEVNFGDCLQVSGLRFCEKGGLFTLEINWRCLNPTKRPLCCFAHVVDAGGRLLGSLDHEILRGKPPITEWKAGDAGCEARCLILPARAARGASLRLGVFDFETGLRTPAWASTVPLVDDYTTAVIDPETAPGAGFWFEMEPAPIEECNVEFEGGLQLTGYSFRRSKDTAWLRLRWSAQGAVKSNLHFFGHAVAEASSDAPILLSFDQDTGLGRMRDADRGELVVQDIVRNVARLGAQAKFLRAGLFNIEPPLERLAVRRSSLPASERERAIYLPLRHAGAGGS